MHQRNSYAQLCKTSEQIQKSRRTELTLIQREYLCYKLLLVLDELYDIADSLDVLDLILGDLNIELVLKSHYQINNVQGISAQVVLNVGSLCDVVSLNVELSEMSSLTLSNTIDIPSKLIISSFRKHFMIYYITYNTNSQARNEFFPKKFLQNYSVNMPIFLNFA